MQYSARVFLLIALFVTCIIYAHGEVKLSFDTPSDQFARSAPVLLRIKTTNDVNLNGLTITPKLADGESSTTIGPMQFLAADARDAQFPVDMRSPATASTSCINLATGQFFGSLQLSSTSTSTVAHFVPLAETTFSEIYSKEGEYGEFDIQCQIWIKSIPASKTWSSNVIVQWDINTGETRTQTIQLTPPKYSTDMIEYGVSVDPTPKLKKHNDVVGTIEFGFKTSVIGTFAVSLTNGPFVQLYDRNAAKWYCTIPGNDKFARIFYGETSAQIIVTEVTTQDMKCTIQVYHADGTNYNGNGRAGVKITWGGSSSTTFFDWKPAKFNPYSSGSVHVSGDNSYRVGVSISNSTGVPISKNSQVVMTFSNGVDMGKVNKDTSYCDGEKMDFSGQTVTISQFNTDYASSAISCQFVIDTAFNYDQYNDLTYTVSIDETQVKGATGKKTNIPILASQNIQILEKAPSEVINENGQLEIGNFAKISTPKYNILPVKNLWVQIALREQAPIPFEDYKNYISCNYGADELPINIEYDAKTITWAGQIPISADGQTKRDFETQLVCVRQQPQVIKYGLDITVIPDLQINAIIVDDKKYVLASSVYIAHYQKPVAPTEQPSNYQAPSGTQYQICTHASYAIPNTEDLATNKFEANADKFTSIARDIIQESIDGGYEISPMLSPSFTFSPQDNSNLEYYDPEAAPKWYKYTKDVLKVHGGYGLAAGNVDANDYFNDFKYRKTVEYGQYFIASNPKVADVYPALDVSEVAYETNFNLKAATDYVPVTARFGSAGGNYIGFNANMIHWVTPVDKCGSVDGFQLTTGIAFKPDFTQWNEVRQGVRQSILCQLGASCNVSADCDQQFASLGVTVCESSKCTFKPAQPPRFKYINSSSMMSITFAIVIAVIALLF